MTLPEAPVSQVETIPNLIIEAVKYVPVEEYLQIRLKQLQNTDMEGENEREWAQIHDAVKPVYEATAKHQKKYNPNGSVPFSADPLIIISRLILAGITLPQYLLARKEMKGISLSQDLDLTNAVAVAANRSIYK